MTKKITYILSNIDKAIAFEWIIENIDFDKYELSFILLNSGNSELEQYLKGKNIFTKRIILNGKKSYPLAFIKVFFCILKLRPSIVHTHLRDANFIGLFAARLLCIKQRVHTRHSSTFNHQYYPKSVKFDKLVNSLSTDIVAISDNVKQILIKKENVRNSKIHLIHHGFKLKDFNNVNIQSVERIRQKYIQNDNYPVIGVIARYLDLKGHQYQINAFKKILEKYPNAFFIFANANGPDKKIIQNLLKENLPDTSYTEIAFENNLFALYQLFDIYVHTPINDEIEAFGQTYVEALAAGIPSVFTLSGVANEFIKDKKNALVVDYQNSEQIYRAIVELLDNPALRQKIIDNGLKSVKPFELDAFIKKLETLYE